MSDPSASRRQPPSPLVFSPETVLAPIVTQAYSQKHGSGSNTVSMPFIKRHVTRRLKNAKQECDKELQRITNAITAFFEDQLREGDVERGRDFREPRRRSDSRAGDPTTDASEPFTFGELRAALQTEDVGSDGGYEAELDTHRHSRPLEDSPGLNRWSSSPGLLSASASSSPSSLRRQNTLPKDKLPLGPSMSSPGPVYADIPKSVVQPIRSSQGIASRRLSRTIHIPPRQTHSAHSSRSTSRSRSPLPRSSHASFAESTVSSSPNRRSSRILIDDPIDPMMTALYDIIAVATDITDTTMNQLTAEPKICSGFVHRVQELGKVWDEHPDWHGRNWFVQVLLAVASLSRVVEWWEAEKQFWNFEDDDEQAEPFTFLLKPADETIPTPTVPSIPGYEAEFLPRRLVDEAEGGLYLPSPSFNQERKPRDEIRKMIGSFPPTPFKPIEQSQLISRTQTATNSARVLAKERLRLQVEKAQSHNIVVELSLDGDRFLWVNYAWSIVVGTDPEDAVGVPISQFLHPSDCDILKGASEQLLADDSHTVEIRFRLRVEPEPNATLMRGTLYQEMEGKGMLMIDSVDAQPTHTMWVIKPVGSPVIVQGAIVKQGADNELSLKSEVEDTEENNNLESVTPLLDSKHISTAVILCRICECNIPEWFFEKHNETCSEVHKFEADIGDCNESITELRNTIRDLRMALDRSSPIENLEYRGVPIFSPATSSTSSSPLHLFRSPLVSRIQRNGIRKTQKRLLEQLDDILQVALEISVPALKEDESREPIERQRLLSPGSDLKIVQVRKWNKPSTEDQGLAHLAADADMLMRTKLDHVSRMQNTIKYSEKVRQEWEEKLEQILIPGDSEDDNGSSNNCEEIGYDDNTPFDSYTTVATPDTITSSEENTQDVPSSTSFNNSKERLGSSHVTPTPISNQNHTTSILSRSSTPSSASSPLARAVPIVASPEPPSALLPSAAVSENYVIKKRSISNIEPRVTITPPLSPSIVPKDSVGFSNRRLSILSTVAPIGGPMSPRIPSVAPSSRSTPTSIKDFEIIKPISKGAFGSVFLAKKKATGDYYAIKVLKKADMIAKNQITNVKAERMILMNQAESPFVAKLYFTFQSKDNLYLVMEYLNGGDCAALIKSLGSLPEDWTRNYIAEVVLGLEYLHQRGIVHRDLKPDNLLIDQHGHLKLTDFGLSRIGLLGRQTREAQSDLLRSRSKYSPGSRPPSMDSAYMSSPLFPNDVISGGSYFNQRMNATSQNVSQPFLSSGPPTDDISESSGSESLSGFFFRRSNKYGESPLQSFANELTNDLRSYSTSGPGTPPSEQKFVGTPDYLAPESILGIAGDDVAVDWWALGVITYEFLYGFPPFHDETPEKVFENILSGHVDWHEDWIDFSSDALDFMKRLLTVDARNRLGANGAQEVKVHPFFSSVDWEKITTAEAAFVPHLSDPESTDYFDPRGASHQLFHDDDLIAVGQSAASPGTDILEQAAGSTTGHVTDRERTVMPADDGFGTFNFKNLPVLKQANDDVIRKLRTDQMVPIVHALSEPANIMRPHRRSVSQRMKKPPHVNTSLDNKPSASNPPSPATSASSVASSPSLASIAPSTPGSSGSHIRKFSEIGVVERFKFNQMDNDVARRNSMPSRLRTASVSTNEDQSSVSDHWPTSSGQHRRFEGIVASTGNTTGSIGEADNRAVTCLLAEDNPITAKIIETLLNRLGCHCIVVADGSEAISVALGDIKFDCILMDLHMPVVDGESAARYIKSTMNKNTSVPIIAISAYSGHDTNVASNLFAASLAKPVQKADLITAMRHLGFKTYHQDGTATKVAPTL